MATITSFTLPMFTFAHGQVLPGLAVGRREYGRGVHLGHRADGGHPERVGFDRSLPPDVMNRRVFRAAVERIEPSPGEPHVWVLAKEKEPRSGVLMRINAWAGHFEADGEWGTVAGAPIPLVAGHGAHRRYGREVTWYDGLVVMTRGDVIWIQDDSGVMHALWLEKDLPTARLWRDVLVTVVRAGKRATQSYGLMKAVTFAYGTVIDGLKVLDGSAGPALVLGQEGPRRWTAEVPLLGATVVDGRVHEAGVLTLWPGTESLAPPRGVYALNGPTAAEADGTLLVRVAAPYTQQRDATVVLMRGEAAQITHGRRARAPDGRRAIAPDSLWMVRPGAVIGAQSYTLENRRGELIVSDLRT